MNWLIGPQTVGFAFLIAGAVQYYYPPKKINTMYGYRMPSAMKSEEAWRITNNYAARFMIWEGLLAIITGELLTFVFKYYVVNNPAVTAGLIIFPALLLPVLLIIFTEKHLNDKLGDTK
jgi:uncharacterized membrane protein